KGRTRSRARLIPPAQRMITGLCRAPVGPTDARTAAPVPSPGLSRPGLASGIERTDPGEAASHMSSDIVIVGAGCMGASTAYHLVQRDPSLQVTVYDRDLSLARASTLLSDGNVRIQFNLEENVLLSRSAMERLGRLGGGVA